MVDSEHPLARAIVTAARTREEISAASEFRAITSRGVEAVIDGSPCAVEDPVLLRERSLGDRVGDLAGVAGDHHDAFDADRASYRKMRQNLAWAAGYIIISIPLAAGALSWAGITLAPAIGAILMSFSTIVVALNAQLLGRVQLRAV